MTANGRISQFTPLKQPTSDYLSPPHGISKKLNTLAEWEVAHA